MKFVEYHSCAWALLVECGYTTAWVELGIACMLPCSRACHP